MIFTAKIKSWKFKGSGLRLLVGALAMCLLLSIGVSMAEEAPTTNGGTLLTVGMKGVATDDGQAWRSLSISGRFDVKLGDRSLGQVRANPSDQQVAAGETDTLEIPADVASIYLVPVAEDFQSGFACQGPVAVQITQGEINRVMVVAYAQQGLFAVKDTIQGTAEPAPGGEYVVMDQSGKMLLSFATDENGVYQSQRALPNGEYRLVQMRAGEGTLPSTEGWPLTIHTYYGNPTDVVAVNLASLPVPVDGEKPSFKVQEPIPFAQDGGADTTANFSTLVVSPGRETDNTIPLRDCTVRLLPTAVVDTALMERPSGSAVVVESVTANIETAGMAISVQGLSEKGIKVGAPKLAASGQTVVLEDAVGAMVTYVNAETGEAVAPEGFRAGTLTLSLVYQPVETSATEHAPREVLVTAEASYQIEYPDRDGNSMVTERSAGDPLQIRIPISDGKIELTFSAKAAVEAQGGRVSMTLSGGDNLPGDTGVAAVLPEGARADMRLLEDGIQIVRTPQRDLVVFSLARAKERTVEIPLRSGSVDALTVLVRDPQTFPQTIDDPKGTSIRAEAHESSPLLDTLLGKNDGMYAEVPCTLEGGVFLEAATPCDERLLDGIMYEDIDQSGTRTKDEPVAAHRGILLEGEHTGVYYGAVTDEEGRFALYAQAGAGDGKGTLMALLPENTMGIGTYETGRMERKGVKVPDTDYPLSYVRMAMIRGKVTLDGSRPMAGVTVSLTQGGETLLTVETDASGQYRFEALAAGEYRLSASVPQERKVALTAASAQKQANLWLLETDMISLTYGQEQEIPIAAMSLGTLQGTVTQGETPAQGMNVALTTPGGEALMQKTDENGAYLFDALVEGEYQLSIDLPAGIAAVCADGEEVKALGQYTAPVRVTPGAAVKSNIELSQTAALAGRISQLGEGQTIALASLKEQASATTQKDGSFQLDGLSEGDYTVYAPLMEGKGLPADSPWQVTQKGDMMWISVTLTAGNTLQLPGVEFNEMTSIEGVAYLDENGDLSYQEGDQLMSGVTVALQRKEGGSWVDVADSKTDEYGAYSFRNLESGDYRVSSMVNAEGLYVAAVGKKSLPLGTGGVMTTGEIKLTNGQKLQGASDIALAKPGELRFMAFSDSNENGLRGEYERPIAGVKVEVLESGGQTVMASGTTDATGEVTVRGVRPGEHSLRVTLPAGYKFTQKGEGAGIGVSCVGGEELTAVSDPMLFAGGLTVESAAGAIPVGSFGGRVWIDENNNGIMDAGEPGAGGVTLVLEGQKTKTSQTIVTNENGEYCFSMLRNDTYRLTAQLPDGYLFAKYSQTGGNARSIFTGEGQKASREFPVTNAADVVNKNVGVIAKGVVEGIAFLDANYNGVYDEGEPGYPKVTLEIIKASNSEAVGKTTTDENGFFRFENLRGGEYRLRAILPDDGSIFSVVPQQREGQVNLFEQRGTRRENTITGITIETGGQANLVVGVARGAKIKGVVFLDQNYDGVMTGKEKKASGVKVELIDASRAVVGSTTTNADGKYMLEGVMPGDYILRFLRKDNYAFTRYRPQEEGGSWVKALEGNYGVTEALTVTMGEDITGVNAGMLPSSTLAGVLFNDLNDNGLMDEGEMGMENAQVRLHSEDAEIDLTVPVKADGSYFFDGVMPGEYTLTYLLPEHVELSRVAEGGNTLKGEGRETTTKAFSVQMGKEISAPLVGAVRLGTWEGYLFHDVNANGIKDQGEESMTGLEITLTPDRTDLEIVKAQTDSEGRFSIMGLRPASYQLGLKLPEGFIFSANIQEAGLTMDTAQEQKMTCPWSVLISRKGNAIGAVRPGTMKGYVWLDENRDGQQTPEETLLSGLAYELVDENKGRTVKKASSAEDGHVTFENVRPGTYTVRFALPSQSEPAGESAATMQAQSGDMVQKGIVMAEGETFQDIHAGLVCKTSMAGMLVLEENGSRTPQEGLTVKLYLDGQAEPLQTTQTGPDGGYRFRGLWPGAYRIEAELPGGLIFVRPDDTNYPKGSSVIEETGGSVGTSAPIQLRMARNQMKLSVIYIRPAKVGDLAFLDMNKNGLLDADEPVIPGITVTLLKDGQPVYETTTDEYGYYLFTDVYPGTYTLQAKAYPELGITKVVPQLRMISSCLVSGDGSLATSDAFTVLSGSKNFDYDLGFVLLDGSGMPAAIVPPPQKDWTGAYVSGTGN